MERNLHLNKLLLICLISFIMIASLLLSTFSVEGVFADVEEEPTPPAPPTLSFSGSGTQEDPYLISSKADLTQLKTDTESEGNKTFKKYFKLTTDIEYSDDETLTAIGTMIYPFKGYFDGSGYLIKNATLSLVEGHGACLGLFGVTSGANIKNVGLSGYKCSLQNLAGASQAYIGSIVGYATSTKISNCFATTRNIEDAYDIDVSAYFSLSIGGLVGSSNGCEIKDSFSTLKIKASVLGTMESTTNLGGIVGESIGSTLRNDYSLSNLYFVLGSSQNLLVTNNIGGLCGIVSGTYTNIINNIFGGNISVFDGQDSNYNIGGIIGALTTNPDYLPVAGSINYSHYVQSATQNYGMNPIGYNKNSMYITTGLVLLKRDADFFQSQPAYVNTGSLILWDPEYYFDFINIWLSEGVSGKYPVLQMFAYYDVSFDLVLNCTLSITGGTEVDETTKRFKAGESVEIVAIVDEAVNQFYSVDGWKRDGLVITGEKELSISFICSYDTKGKYTIVLKAKTFALNISIFADNATNGYFRYGASQSLVGPLSKTPKYGDSVTLVAEPKANYAFEGWYIVDGENYTKINTADSPTLEFIVGSNDVAFKSDLSIKLEVKFTRDITYLTVDFDNTLGKIKIYEDEEFSNDNADFTEKAIRLGSTLTLFAEETENSEFVGWYSDEKHEELISKNKTYSGYELTEDNQSVYALFKSTIVEEDKGLPGWAIALIVVGGVLFIGLIVLVIILIKRRGGGFGGGGSYKSAFKNFGY